ncbi:MAG: hypothetical protein JXJ22_12880 [Bacteroidales bacterium]|nr:hypothetical protein [Bacteroidales bacterium]
MIKHSLFCYVLLHLHIIFKTLTGFYIGQTSDINERLFRHINGYEKYTSKGIPWVLLDLE